MLGDPEGSLSKIAIKVYYIKSKGLICFEFRTQRYDVTKIHDFLAFHHLSCLVNSKLFLSANKFACTHNEWAKSDETALSVSKHVIISCLLGF